ncbi:hypothetical protein LTR85_000064 [Meristemomyces frigidus]|nr:hypothetical protein LTR85_000064 [Meristemomyces frigidus]
MSAINPVISDKQASTIVDIEKDAASSSAEIDRSLGTVEDVPGGSLWARLTDAGIEGRGAQPVPVEERTDTRFLNIFTVFATSMTSILPNGKVGVEVGIVIVIIVAALVAFCGYSVLHMYERWAWIPVVIAIIFVVGIGGPQLDKQPAYTKPDGKVVMDIIAFQVGNFFTWANVAGDYAVYMPPNTPRLRLGLYCMGGIVLPCILLMTLGAAIGGAVPNIAEWHAAYELYSVGGTLGAMVGKIGGFGKFIMVVLTLSVIGTTARDFYTISVNLPGILPPLGGLPRFLLVIATGGAVIGIAIAASRDFFVALETFLAIIGYYAGANITVVFIEYLYFRKANPENYDPAIWDDAALLPPGYAALASVLIPWALVIPSMDEQPWYTGPIASKTGDLGFEFAVVLAALLYFPLRTIEIKWARRV